MNSGAISPVIIPFSEKWPKLYWSDFLGNPVRLKVGNEFHTVRGADKYDYYLSKVEKEAIIEVKGTKLYRAVITGVLKALLGDLTDEFIQNDTTQETSRKRFYDMMHNWYHKKPWWDGWNTVVTIIFVQVREFIKEGKTCWDCSRFPCASAPVVEQGKVIRHEQLIWKDDHLNYCGGQDYIPKV